MEIPGHNNVSVARLYLTASPCTRGISLTTTQLDRDATFDPHRRLRQTPF